jgi:hypothetical protein
VKGENTQKTEGVRKRERLRKNVECVALCSAKITIIAKYKRKYKKKCRKKDCASEKCVNERKIFLDVKKKTSSGKRVRERFFVTFFLRENSIIITANYLVCLRVRVIVEKKM